MPAPGSGRRPSGPRGAGRGPRGARGPMRRPSSRAGGDDRPSFRFSRKKMNRFFTVFPQGTTEIDYKDIEKLTKFLTEKGKIIPRRMSGLTAKQQRHLARAIKQARHAGLLAFQGD